MADVTTEYVQKLATLRQVRTDASRVRAQRLWRVYGTDPVAFVNDCIPDLDMAEYQAEELQALADRERVITRGIRGCGKTTTKALAAIWWWQINDGFADWKLPTTAGVWRQLEKFLWPEIRKMARMVRWDLVNVPPPGRNTLLTLNIKGMTGEGFALASNDPDLIEGAHADHLMLMIDEGKAVPDGSYDAAEGYFSDPGHKRLLVGSTPGAPIGRFHDICMNVDGKYPDWHRIHVTPERAIRAGRVKAQWVEDRKREWGEENPFYKQQVEAEFAGEGDDAIPVDWIDLAFDRWRELQKAGRLRDGACSVVCADLADTGADHTVVAELWDDMTIPELQYLTGGDLPGEQLMATAGMLQRMANQLGPLMIVVDATGMGAGVAGLLRENGYTTGAYQGAAGTGWTDQSGELEFANTRSAAWWNLREQLHPDIGADLALPPDERLKGELVAPKWQHTAAGKVRLEPKEQVVKRLGRSTDAGDTVAMAFWYRQLMPAESSYFMPTRLGRGVPR